MEKWTNKIHLFMHRQINRHKYPEKLPTCRFVELFPEYASAEIRLRYLVGVQRSVRLQELTYLAFLAGMFKDAQIFEFGTSMGRTALNLALNLRGNGKVFTLDLPQDFVVDERSAGYLFTVEQSVEVRDLERGSLLQGQRDLPIVPLTGESTSYDYSPYYEEMNLVFIDGGHSKKVVESDSDNAFRMLKPGAGIIVWHDYWSYNCPEVVQVLNTLCQTKPLYKIIGTRMAIYTDIQ